MGAAGAAVHVVVVTMVLRTTLAVLVVRQNLWVLVLRGKVCHGSIVLL